MGQRHQLYVIARINERYRNLASVHHQWLYGFTALKRCHGLVQTFQAIENRIPIQQELLSARHRDENSWKEDSNNYETRSLIPFPMITTCLVLGASFGVTDGYLSGVDIEPFGSEYDEVDNNNGITVIDISELHRIRYCFVDIVPGGMESQTPVPLMTPLSASTYLWSYYNERDPKDQDQDQFKDLIARLEKWDLVEIAALRETWPTWRDPTDVELEGDEPEDDELTEDEPVEGELEEVAESGDTETTEQGNASREEELYLDGAGSPGATGTKQPEELREVESDFDLSPDPLSGQLDRSRSGRVSTGLICHGDEASPNRIFADLSIDEQANLSIKPAVPQTVAAPISLRDSAMRTILEAALKQSEADLRSWMPEAEALHDFLPCLKRKLYEDPDLLQTSPAGLFLLCKALKNEEDIDLTPLKSLTINDISKVLSELRETGKMKSLALCNMPDLKKEDLENICLDGITLGSLFVLGTPLISVDSIVSYINSHVSALQNIYHTELLRRPLKLGLKRWQLEDKIDFSMNHVNQMVWAKPDLGILDEEGMRFEDGRIDWRAVWSSIVDTREFPICRLAYGVSPLTDILLTPTKIVTGLLRFLEWMTRSGGGLLGSTDHGIAIANSFAMAKPSIHGSDFQVGPLSSALYATKTKSYGVQWPWKTTQVTPGKWTIVVLHEESSRQSRASDRPNLGAKMRCAMVTVRDSPSQDLVVVDMPTFLRRTMTDGDQSGSSAQELQDYWIQGCKNVLPGNDEVEFCDEAEVRDLLQAVFAPENEKKPHPEP